MSDSQRVSSEDREAAFNAGKIQAGEIHLQSGEARRLSSEIGRGRFVDLHEIITPESKIMLGGWNDGTKDGTISLRVENTYESDPTFIRGGNKVGAFISGRMNINQARQLHNDLGVLIDAVEGSQGK